MRTEIVAHTFLAAPVTSSWPPLCWKSLPRICALPPYTWIALRFWFTASQ